MIEHSRLDYILGAVENDADYPMSIQIAKAELAALRSRVAELEAAQAVVTPNNCRHCHKAAEQMRENAAATSVVFAKYAERKDLSGGYSCREVAEQIRALPLPTCGDCNQLAPSDHADSLQAWADLWSHINKRLGYVEGDLLPNASNFDHMLLSVVSE